MTPNANWITSPRNAGEAVYTYQKALSLKKEVKKAILYASALGVYVPYLDGKKIGNGVLAPGWTSYNTRIQYQTYDVTDMIGANSVLSFGVGQGWAVGYMGFESNNHFFADRVSFWACLALTYADGTTETVATGEDWEVYTSQVTFAEIYHGETIDLTAPIERVGNAVLSTVKGALVEQEGEWITEQERLAPVAVIHTPAGETVLDFGQNMTGYVELRIQAARGARTVIHHAEVLDKDGNFYNANYRSARNELIYVCSGGEDVFKPAYSFQGFRYIKLVEYPLPEVDPNGFCAIVVHSEMKRTCRFVTGNAKINQLYHNIVWGQKSNYLDIPTDCPQRDERLGWTGDAQVFCRTAAINFDVEKFFRKWLSDVAIEQGENGSVQGIVPNCIPERPPREAPTRISAAWGDVACIAPWQIYLAYGDKELLRRHYPMMKKWVDYMHGAGPEEYLWLGGEHYGDWLAMDGDADDTQGATACDLIASAFFAYSTEHVIKAGEVLGEDVSEYRALYAKVKEAFRAYFMENGIPKAHFDTVRTDLERVEKTDPYRRGMTQTALVLILHFGLCTEEERAPMVKTLVKMIRDNDTLMTTGFVGTPYLLHALSDNGETALAYELLYREKNPSWLFSVCHGATTMWEHWNSQREDGSFWSTSMNSFNHYAYGAVFDWIFGVSAGIKPVEADPAYKTVAIAPHPDKKLGFLDTTIQTRNGDLRLHWYYKNDTVYYELEIPQGMTAYFTLPSGKDTVLGAGVYGFAE